MPEIGFGVIQYRFEAFCGGCGKTEALAGSTANLALMDAIQKKWGQDPTIGVVCPRCVKKIAEAAVKMAKERREEESKIILTDERD
jgi:hypothetical protein